MSGIKQLAEHLNLSIWTISRALNGKPDVSAETRRRVFEAAARFGYEPNQSGLALRTGKTGAVGFIMRTGDENSSFFSTVLDGVQSVLWRHRLDLIALLCPSEEDADEFLRRAVARRSTDALILTDTRGDDGRIAFLQQRRVPFVTFGRSGNATGYLWFDADIDCMADQAAERLVAQGHRRFSILAANDGQNFNDAFAGRFCGALRDSGVPPQSLSVLNGRPNEAGGHALALELLGRPEPPTAIVILSEAMTLGVYQALRDRQLVPGREISLIGFDSPPARFISPPLTSFRLPLREIGIEMARGLLHILTNGSASGDSFSGQRLWPATLLPGQSDGPAKGNQTRSTEQRLRRPAK